MLDFGWPELFVIVAFAILFVGPEELPRVMVALGRVVRRLQYIRYEISRQFEEVMREADLDDIRKSVNFDDGDALNIEEDVRADEAYAMMGLEGNEEEKEEESKDHE